MNEQNLTPEQVNIRKKEQTANIIAILIATGFLSLCFFVLSGRVDVSQPVVASLVSYMLGLLSGALTNNIALRYFGVLDMPKIEPKAPKFKYTKEDENEDKQ